jgi:hypothetical protein
MRCRLASVRMAGPRSVGNTKIWSRPSVRLQKGYLLWMSSRVVWNALFSAAAALHQHTPAALKTQ